MITINLPTLEKSIGADDKLVVKEGEIKCAIDTSLMAEERWEQNFKHNAEKETLFAYIERVQNAGLAESPAHVLSNLKALYCFIESDDLPDWKAFVRLFDLASGDYLKRLCAQIKRVFEIALSAATVDQKNS